MPKCVSRGPEAAGAGPAGWLQASHRAQLRSTLLRCRLRAARSSLFSSRWSHLFRRPFVPPTSMWGLQSVSGITRGAGERRHQAGPELRFQPCSWLPHGSWHRAHFLPGLSFLACKIGQWFLLQWIRRIRWGEVLETFLGTWHMARAHR